ncbi:MAG: dihydrodipicolinate synthase family protein [Firmicutes bacterium]|nr:dihydrodipicolinate synthase family protein [Bacillota bacterium]
MKKAQFLVPTVVSFHEDGSVDYEGNAAVAEHLIAGGVDGLLIMGSTGEFYSMRYEDKKRLIDASIATVNHRVRVFFGTNCMRLEDTIALSNYAIDAGADGVMIIGPYYFSIEDRMLERYFDDLCDAIHGDVFLYNYPERTGYDFPVQVAVNLLRKHPNIKGFKDSHSQLTHTRSLINATREEFPDFEVYAGFDENLAHVVLSGGVGSIGGLGNIYPEICAGFAQAVNSRDLDRIERYQVIMNRMSELYAFGTPFIPIIKEAMRVRGVKVSPYCQHPVLPPTAEQCAKIADWVRTIDEMAAKL